jgi:hypothetical protein
MIGHLKTAFNSLVDKSQWMDSETKMRALEKAAAMKEFVAYPDWILDKTQLTLAYQGVCFSSIFIIISSMRNHVFPLIFTGGNHRQESL